MMARAFDCSPMDITAPDKLLLDPPMQQRYECGLYMDRSTASRGIQSDGIVADLSQTYTRTHTHISNHREGVLRARVQRKERAAAALRAEPFFQDLVAQNLNAAIHMSGTCVCMLDLIG